MTNPTHPFGARRIYYNNFASHLLNAYNPNMLYPGLPNRWSDEDWRRLIDMIAGFGFNVFEFWLVPGLFCRKGLASEAGAEFTRQLDVIMDYASRRGIATEMILALSTVGADWHTHCPNVKEEWDEVVWLWDTWTRRLPKLAIVGIFPGDPGGCSRNGCTAETYIDRSADIAALVRRNLPFAEIEFNTWGNPFFGWGTIQGPPGWNGEFIQDRQHTAWQFDKARADRAMRHLLKRLPDFPDPTSVGINMGFDCDGNPGGDMDACGWAHEIAKTNRILTWDFSLTEGENAIVPHYRFDRLFERRRQEREAAPYSGGICFTMTPLLNQLSLFESARSLADPDADHAEVAAEFFTRLFGTDGARIAELLPCFEVVPDWGSYAQVERPRHELRAKMIELLELLQDLKGEEREDMPFHPTPVAYRRELLFFARFFAAALGHSGSRPRLRERYWNHIYAIYDQLPAHVDPRPHSATQRLVERLWDMT